MNPAAILVEMSCLSPSVARSARFNYTSGDCHPRRCPSVVLLRPRVIAQPLGRHTSEPVTGTASAKAVQVRECEWSEPSLARFRLLSYVASFGPDFNRRCNMSMNMVEGFLPRSATRVVVYLKPISMRWGPEKLRTFCREVIGIEPDQTTCFLFVNRRCDTLLAYFLTFDGDQTLMRKLDKGAFLLPAPEAEKAPFVILRPSMLTRLFRS